MIESMSEALGGVGATTVYALLAFAAFQLALQAWALVDLLRREHVQFGRKWIWLLIILVMSSAAIGAIVYLAWGRKVDVVAEQIAAPQAHDRSGRAERAVSSLYGTKGDER